MGDLMKKLTALSIVVAAAILVCVAPAHARVTSAQPAGQPAGAYRQGASEVEVSIATDDPRVVLAGTLLVPESAEGRTVVLMVTGTGNHLRDQVISGAPTFRLIAEELASAGVATLRLDVRGAGASTGPKATESTMAERVLDMCAALRWLRGGEQGAFEAVGILGHSAGATIATELVARDCASPDFVILLGAPALKGSDIWVAQQAAPFRDVVGDSDPTALQEVVRRLETAAALSIAGEGAKAMRENAIALFALADIDVTAAEHAPMLAGFTARMTEPAMRDFLGGDPGPALEKTTVPVLAIYGSHDELTSVAQNAGPLLEALVRAGNPDVTLRVLPYQDHFFLRAPGKQVGEHSFGEMELAPSLLREIRAWLEARRR
jgi:pimeloyl-ACP methyl ester carboxylesterase